MKPFGKGGDALKDLRNNRGRHRRWLAPALLIMAFAGIVGGGDLALQPSSAVDFLARVAALCGQAYAGRVVANEPPNPSDPFAGKALVMHVRECGATEIRIPFHVGDDHSRTWVLTRTATGLRLKHDHRHQDGSPDAVTLYGGDTTTPGTAGRQEFPVDLESAEMFERQGMKASVTNVWAFEIEAGQRFVYELARPGRLFRVEFDLAKPVSLPPEPWGETDAARGE